MNKIEIINKLNKSGLDKERILVLSGASLVMQDIINNTDDIDLSCDKEYYDLLDWETKIGAYGVEIKCKDVFEISYNLYYPNDAIKIAGYSFLNLNKCLDIKKELGRNKDKNIIDILEKVLCNNLN